MKKIILLLLISLAGNIANAQYKTFKFGDKKYNSHCQKLSDGTVFLSIILDGINPLKPNPQLITMSKQQRVKLVSNLKMIRNKFLEYDSICKRNNVENISRIINHEDDIDEQPIIVFDNDGKYYNVSPLHFAYVRIEGHGTMCLHSGELVDAKDESIHSDGGLIMFYSTNELDEIIQSFEEDEIMKYINLLN